MKNLTIILTLAISLLSGNLAIASDDHDQKAPSKKDAAKKDESGHEHEDDHKNESGHKEDEHGHEDEHSDEGEHAHGDEGHEEEGGGSVGPDKGITEKAEAGFKLSPESIKTIGIQTKAYSGGLLQLPLEAIVTMKTEKTVFRLRSGWYKRVKIEILNKNPQTTSIKSTSFRDGDQIVITGTGFLRIAEIFAEEGASHSHSH